MRTIRTINREKLKQKLDNNEDFVFLNVLSEEQYEKEHIPSSDNIPYDADDLEQQVEQKARSKDVEIIVYCADKDCPASEKAAKRLEDSGFTNVKDFEGGMKDWKDAGYDVEGKEAEKQAA